MIGGKGRNSFGTQSGSIVCEFKAGKITVKSDDMAHPDKRRGLLFVKTQNDRTTHLCWKDRSNDKIEDDIIVKPTDCQVTRVKDTPSGRIICIKIAKKKPLFFWLQDLKTDQDDENIEKLTKALTTVTSASQNPKGERNSAANQFSPSNNTVRNSVNTNDIMSLRNYLLETGHLEEARALMESQNDDNEMETDEDSADVPNHQAEVVASMKAFPGIFTKEALAPVMNKEVHTKLADHLPPTEYKDLTLEERFKSNIESEQFKSTLSSFAHAFVTGQLPSLISQFNLGDEAVSAASVGNIEVFLESLQSKYSKQ